jgi:crotonobetainyl-CoA:carnitine CoA-transferase CaiB-like acyl-CoA transferase
MYAMGDTSMTFGHGKHIGFETANRSKRGITLNLKEEKGKEIFYQLIEKADIFYTNYRESVLRRLGADYATVSKRKPSLIYGKIDMFGTKGAWGERRGYDFMAQARSGLMWAMGERDWPEPVLAYGSICDETGATHLAFGLVSALLAKERSGVGQKVETSIYGSMVHLQCMGINLVSFRGRAWARHSRTRVREPMSNYYKCADDKWILLCEPRADQYWAHFARVLGREDMGEDPRFCTAKGRRENYEELISILDNIFASKSLEDWIETFEEQGLGKAGFAYCPIFDYYDVIDDPQAADNGYIVPFDHPDAGSVKIVGPSVQFSATPARIQCASPEHGQHTEEVLSEVCGISWEDMADLRDQGVI